jgi:hypothetical protein
MYKVKAIMPRRRIPSGFKMKQALHKSFKETEKVARDGLDKFTQTWNKQPKWETKIGKDYIRIKTRDKRVKWIDEGTKPYKIRPKRRNGRLKFFMGGKPKTIPGRSVAVKGSKGKMFVVAKEVNHPGIRPRHALRIIVDKAEKQFRRTMTREINDAIERATASTE